MKVVNPGPWWTRTLWWQPRPGAWSLAFICHLTIEIAPGESTAVAPPIAAAEQDEVRALVEPWGPIAPFKRWPEVVVVGHAHAPSGQEARRLTARLAFGGMEKVVEVHGDSYLGPDGSVVGPAGFTRMPLRWERAAGGPHTLNPVGIRTGPGAVADRHGRVMLPNFRPPSAAAFGAIEPAGFGPLRPEWHVRASRLHRYAAGWDHQRWAERPLPPDLDGSYFDVAPWDQATAEISGEEILALDHLHPRHERLSTRLRAPVPTVAYAAGSAAPKAPVPVRCDTIVIDADAGVAVLVWRGIVSTASPEQDGVLFVGRTGGGAASARQTLMVSGEYRPALPFQPAPSAPPEAPPSVAAPPQEGRQRLPSREANRTITQIDVSSLLSALPFREQPESSAEEEDAPATQRRGAVALVPEESPPAPAAPAFVVPPAPPSVPSTFAVSSPPSFAPSAEPPAPAPPVAPAPTPLTIEETATVAARLASRPDEAAAVLEKEGLSAAEWERQHASWQREIRAEVDRGRKKLLSAYDAAYVSALEALRGPITAEEYARLAIAAERGRAAAELRALKLPEEARMPIQRVWLARTVRDPRAAAEVRAAMRSAATA